MTKFLIPIMSCLASAGRPDRSTELEVGRPGRSTDVHRRARQSGWRAGRPGRSTVQRALLSGKAPVDRAVDQTESLFSVSRPRSTGRSTAGSTVRNLTVGRSTGRSTDMPTWLPTASFSNSINWDFWGLFSTRFFKWFSPVFSTLLRGFLHLYLIQILPFKRRVYQGFSK